MKWLPYSAEEKAQVLGRSAWTQHLGERNHNRNTNTNNTKSSNSNMKHISNHSNSKRSSDGTKERQLILTSIQSKDSAAQAAFATLLLRR